MRRIDERNRPPIRSAFVERDIRPGQFDALDAGRVGRWEPAAHERLIYEEIRGRAPRVQDLLFPLAFDASEDEDRRLAGRVQELAEVGVAVRRVGARAWEIAGLEPRLEPLGAGDIVEVVREALREERKWRERLLATAACRLAIKEGDPVDAATARSLLRGALQLAEPRCPHGRPIWHVMERSQLFRLVDRPE